MPVVHGESWSKHPKRTSDFYARVFDRTAQEMPGLDYRMVRRGGQGGIDGGIMKPQDGPGPGDMAFYVALPDGRAMGMWRSASP